MPKFDKPDSPNIIWGVNALDEDLTRPSDSYIQTGWTQVKPPYEYENYSMNKLYQGFAYYNQLGIPEWDSVTEYQAGKSYVQGSNNKIYKCVQTNSNKNPATSGNSAYWKALDSEILGTGFFSPSTFYGNIPFIEGTVKKNLKLQISNHTFVGISGTQAESPNTNVDHIHTTAVISVVFPEPFQTSCVGVFPVVSDDPNTAPAEGSEYSIAVVSKSTSGATFRITRIGGYNSSGETGVINYMAAGY